MTKYISKDCELIPIRREDYQCNLNGRKLTFLPRWYISEAIIDSRGRTSSGCRKSATVGLTRPILRGFSDILCGRPYCNGYFLLRVSVLHSFSASLPTSIVRTSKAITARWGQRCYSDVCNFHTFASCNLSAAKVDRKYTRRDRETRMYPIEDMHLAVSSHRNIVGA